MIRILAGAAALTMMTLSAQASDPTLREPFSWTGLYAGVHAGYAWGDADHAQTNGGMPHGPYGYDVDGALGGVTLGYNQQFGFVVVGIEAEGGYMDLHGEGKIPSSTPPNYQALDVDGGFYGLIAGRAGFAIDRTLIYGKGGWFRMDGDAGQATTKPGYETTRSESFQGVVYGAGIEHAVGRHMTIKFEWLRFDFDGVTGSQTSLTDPPVGYVYTNQTDLQVDTFKLGLNYKF